MAFLQTTAASISSGGTINGDITIAGDLTVEGSGTYAYDEIVQGRFDVLIDASDGGTTPFIKIIDADDDTTANTKSQILWSKYHTGTSVGDMASIDVGTSEWGNSSGNRHTYMTFNTVADGDIGERVRITDTGKVGIGTSSPEGSVDIIGVAQGTVTTYGSEKPGLIINQQSATDNPGGLLEFRTYNGSDYWTQGYIAGVDMYTASGNTSYAGGLAFYTQPGGTTDPTGIRSKGASLIERMRIDASGNVGIGCTPETYHSSVYALQLKNGGLLTENSVGASKSITLAYNQYVDSGNDWTYINADEASYYQQYNGSHYFATASAGSADATVTNTVRLYISNAGNVGINEGTPDQKLHVSDTGNTPLKLEHTDGADVYIELRNNAGAAYVGSSTDDIVFNTTASGTERFRIASNGIATMTTSGADAYTPTAYNDVPSLTIKHTDGDTYYGNIRFTNSSGDYEKFFGSVQTSGNTSDLVFQGYDRAATAYKEYLRIKENGNVGIGTSDPTTMLHLQSSSSNVPVIKIENNNDDIHPSRIQFVKNVGADAEADGDFLGQIQFKGQDTGDALHTFASIFGVAADVNAGTEDGVLRFAVARAGTDDTVVMNMDAFSRISLSNNDAGTDNTVFGFMAGAALADGSVENTLVGDYAGTALTTGDYNTAVGKNALPSEDVGQSSTAIGYSALGSQNTGSQSHVNNVGVGVNTGYYNGTGTNNTWLGSNAGVGASGQSNSSNVGVGANSMRVVSTGNENVSVGKDSMYDANTASGVVAVGTESAYNITSGSESVAIGKQALYTATTVGANTAVGYQALKLNTVASNTAFGHSAGLSTTGTLNCYFGASAGSGGSGAETNNVGIGASALLAVTSGSYNTVIGAYAGDALTTTNNCTLIGRAAGSGINSTDANETVCVGNDSGEALTSAQHTTAIGYKALGGNSTGDNNTALGHQALLTCTGENNTAIGEGAMVDLVEGNNNVAIGKAALGGALDATADASYGNIAVGKDAMGGAWVTATSNYNIAIGEQAMDDALNGATSNIAIGRRAATQLETGDSNIAIGADSLYASVDADRVIAIGGDACIRVLTSAADNTIAIGHSALQELTSGAGNIAVGYQSQDALTIAGGNTTVGYKALSTEVEGQYNTAVGYESLVNQNAGGSDGSATATSNTAVGFQAGDLITTGSNCVLIGTSADPSANSASNQIVIGSGATGQADNSVTLGNADVTAVYMGQDSGARVFAERLDLKRAADPATLRLSTFDVAADTASTIYLETSNHDTADNYAAVDANDILGQVFFNGSNGSGSESGGWIRCTAAETWDSDSRGTTFTLALVPSGANSTTLTNRLYIDGSGNFTGSASSDISDEGLKENIKDVENGLDTIKKLQGRTFTWKDSAYMPEGTKYGLIAQELEKVLPDLVHDKSGIREKEDGSYYKSIQMTGVIPVLIEAVKELSAKVEALESKG